MKLLIFAIAIMLSIGFMGCIGGETPKDEGKDKDTGNGGTDTGTTGGNGGSGDVDDGGTETQGSDFWDYLDAKSTGKWKVEYTLTSSDVNQLETTQMTVYVSGKNTRTDIAVEGTEVRAYITNNKMYSCSNYGEGWQCFDLGDILEENTEDLLKESKELYSPIALPDETIAGIAAKCYKLEDVDGYALEYCFGNGGVPLRTKTTGDDLTIEMIATSYSTAVTDADFVLPAEATEMPSYDYGTE